MRASLAHRDSKTLEPLSLAVWSLDRLQLLRRIAQAAGQRVRGGVDPAFRPHCLERERRTSDLDYSIIFVMQTLTLALDRRRDLDQI